ncbi:hypothetical protein [Cohnella abietis]|uniref:Flagellar hook-length control protein-like C-terminal domain-containing protein n=1 Tax=Cohnella abietis TaxID=2507935 RepID=A0A3T1D8P7_9BACL|nr:hypothetical protein [Cohnella abietis]BBI34460.1 hypothetical protein KCTCHS21_38590 [Cohnella abietis]
MGMNIGPMMRALMGDAQPTDSRSLELRIGQIVRGVLVELLDNQEAMININGVQVKAKLDAEMLLGKSTLLQVQPGGSGGLVTLKPLTDTSDALPEEGLKDILKSFGLTDQKSSMELIRGLKRDGYPIGKETAAFFNTAASLKPAGVDAASWSNAADVAFRRGLAPTETTLSSLRQALFGQPIHEELANMKTELGNWLGGAGARSPEATALGQRLQSLLAQGNALIAEGEAQLAGKEGLNNAATSKGTEGDKAQIKDAAVGSRMVGEFANQSSDAAAGKSNDGSAGRANGNAAPLGTGAQGQGQGQGQVQGQVQGQGAFAANSAANAAGQGAQAAAPEGNAATANRVAAVGAGAAESSAAAPKQADAAQPSAPKPEAAWIGRFLQWLGTGHERQLMHGAEARLPGDAAGLPAGGAAALAPGADAPGQEARHAAADTLKGALLALAAHDDVPPALREAAQTLANQVTGQQLLLSSDRSNVAPFSHMTLFVPMKGQDGETTATIHVQTRRSRRGEWDVDNCHLMFDLRMRNLGDTLVDVQVVDRIVSLKLLSDFSGMTDLLEHAREELASGMTDAGFQLLSLTTAPLPPWKNGAISSTQSAAGTDTPAISSTYTTKPYKGVDYRA